MSRTTGQQETLPPFNPFNLFNPFNPSMTARTCLSDIRAIVSAGVLDAAVAVHRSAVLTYWRVGRRIVEEEQGGRKRAEYGTELLAKLAASLVPDFGSSYSQRNLFWYRRFYLGFREEDILNARVQNLTWTHFRSVLGEPDEAARLWYVSEASKEGWSSRELAAQVGRQAYHRLLAPPAKDAVLADLKGAAVFRAPNPEEVLRSPVLAEFTHLATNPDYTERELETAILDHLQRFLMELGKGFAFVARQFHVATQAEDYFVDLAFYNYLLKCFVLVDLKTSKIRHQDVGQMDMYVRLFDEFRRTDGDNPTVGIVLCAETDEDIARYSVLHGNKRLFAAKYMTVLPAPELLRDEVLRQKEIFYAQHPRALPAPPPKKPRR